MYSLATVRTLFSALRSELCSIGTGVTEKVTKTFHSAEGQQPSKPTWVSVQDVVLNLLRPSTQPSQPLPELSHFYTHKHRNKMFAHVAMVLVGVSRLDTKQMRSRQLTSFCQLHKSDQKHMSSQKVFTSRHGLFV